MSSFKRLYCSPSSPSDIERKTTENRENQGVVRYLSASGESCQSCSSYHRIQYLGYCEKKDKHVRGYNICHLHTSSKEKGNI
jgi:hypothetical protein